MKRVLLDESVSEEIILSYIERGFQPHFQSKRKVKRKDRKVYNKIRKFGIDPDRNLRFGNIKPEDWDVIDFGDPILDKLMLMGKDRKDLRILKSVEVKDIEGALTSQQMVNDISLMFVKVKVLYSYELKEGVQGNIVIPGTRDFCRKMIEINKLWSLEEIQSINTEHLKEMGLPQDVFLYKGGFWRQNDGNISPSCRHTFKANVVIE
jgi:hypothetical protein